MKANPRSPIRPPSRFPLPAWSLPLAVLIAPLAACVPPPPSAPAPTAPAPRPSAPAPGPAPSPAPTLAPDWRDAPATPGDWQWRTTATGSLASFAGGQFAMRCERAQGSVALFRAVPGATAPLALTIATGTGSRVLSARPVSGGVEVAVSARDPVLDAMAFSRGRFAVLAGGVAPLYVPSWTEVSRVIEDCR